MSSIYCVAFAPLVTVEEKPNALPVKMVPATCGANLQAVALDDRETKRRALIATGATESHEAIRVADDIAGTGFCGTHSEYGPKMKDFAPVVRKHVHVERCAAG